MGPLLHDGEERGVAERAVTKLRSSLAAAGGGLRGAAAKLPVSTMVRKMRNWSKVGVPGSFIILNPGTFRKILSG